MNNQIKIEKVNQAFSNVNEKSKSLMKLEIEEVNGKVWYSLFRNVFEIANQNFLYLEFETNKYKSMVWYLNKFSNK